MLQSQKSHYAKMVIKVEVTVTLTFDIKTPTKKVIWINKDNHSKELEGCGSEVQQVT